MYVLYISDGIITYASSTMGRVDYQDTLIFIGVPLQELCS